MNKPTLCFDQLKKTTDSIECIYRSIQIRNRKCKCIPSPSIKDPVRRREWIPNYGMPSILLSLPFSIIIHIYPHPSHQPRNFLLKALDSRPTLYNSSDWLPLGPIICNGSGSCSSILILFSLSHQKSDPKSREKPQTLQIKFENN